MLASFNSLCVLRLRVILRGAPSLSASLPWLRRRWVRSSSLASSLMRASGPDTLMPAWSSCTSSRSTGTLRTSANWETVTSAIVLTRLEPGRTRRHDERGGLVGCQPLDIRQFIDRLLGEILARAHAAARQGERQIRAHALEQQQIVRRHRLIERLFTGDRLRQQHVAGAVAQLLDHVF